MIQAVIIIEDEQVILVMEGSEHGKQRGLEPPGGVRQFYQSLMHLPGNWPALISKLLYQLDQERDRPDNAIPGAVVEETARRRIQQRRNDPGACSQLRMDEEKRILLVVS